MFAFVLAACSDDDSTPQPGFDTTVEAGEALGTVIPGGTLVPTDTLATQPADVPTLQVTEGISGTADTTAGATVTVTSSEMIPVTAGVPDGGRISNLLDFEVKTKDGDLVGEVENMVLNLDARRVQYVIIGVGGFLGIGEKEVAIPWGAFDLHVEDTVNDQVGDDNDNWLVLNLDKEAIENAPDWDPNTLPKLGEPAADWDVDLRGYWQDLDASLVIDSSEITATSEATDTEGSVVDMNDRLHGMIMASDPIGLKILNDAGDTVAVVEDMVIDVKSGKIIYIIVSVFDGADLDDVLLPIPPAAFRLDATVPALVIGDADRVLVDAPRFKIGEFPYTLEPDWDADVRAFWKDLVDLDLNP
jgi:sporulation protein YlmC with PRC-barrel domain